MYYVHASEIEPYDNVLIVSKTASKLCSYIYTHNPTILAVLKFKSRKIWPITT